MIKGKTILKPPPKKKQTNKNKNKRNSPKQLLTENVSIYDEENPNSTD